MQCLITKLSLTVYTCISNQEEVSLIRIFHITCAGWPPLVPLAPKLWELFVALSFFASIALLYLDWNRDNYMG